MLKLHDFFRDEERAKTTENLKSRGVIVKKILGKLVYHITPEAGLSPIKSTIAENVMGVTSRPQRINTIDF